MTFETLAGIVARDAAWTDYRQDPESVSPSADRRALLVLLRETREALSRSHPHDDGDYACGACETYNRLAALDEPTP